jgi:protein SCO1/2
MKRRHCITTLARIGLAGAALGACPAAVLAHAMPGPVSPPVPAPDLSFVDHHGQPQALRRWLTGQVTAVQTIFTGCSSVCPIQGALFDAAQRRLAGQALKRPVRWLSMAISTTWCRRWCCRRQRWHWRAAWPSRAILAALCRSCCRRQRPSRSRAQWM